MTPEVCARSASGSTRMSSSTCRRLRRPSISASASTSWLCAATCFSTRMRVRRSRASATAISCSTSPSFSRMVVRSACGNVGSIRAKRSPFFTACPMRGSPPSGAITRPPLMLCTRLVLFGSAITRPIRLTARCADCGTSCSVRTSSSRCVGFGTKTCPSGSRRGESTVATPFAAGRAAGSPPAPRAVSNMSPTPATAISAIAAACTK